MPDSGIDGFEEIVPVFLTENLDLFWFWPEEHQAQEPVPEEEEDWSLDDYPSFSITIGPLDSAWWDAL